MNEQKNNGRGVFYGVIGIATLVVAIIGATFAYFSATTNSADNAVQAGGAKITLAYDDSINATAKGLKENLKVVYDALMKAKPSTVKGTYMKNVSVASTMGPGVKVDPESISK